MPHMRAQTGAPKYLVKLEEEWGVQWAEHGSHDAAIEVALRIVETHGGTATVYQATELVSVWKPQPSSLTEDKD